MNMLTALLVGSLLLFLILFPLNVWMAGGSFFRREGRRRAMLISFISIIPFYFALAVAVWLGLPPGWHEPLAMLGLPASLMTSNFLAQRKAGKCSIKNTSKHTDST